jgi:hypothetical protein
MCAVTVFFTETFSPVHLKGDHFVALYMAQYFGLHDTLHIFASGKFTVSTGQQHIGKFHFITGVSFNPGNIDGLVFLDPELASCDLYNCEHKNNIRAAKVRGIGLISKESVKNLMPWKGWMGIFPFIVGLLLNRGLKHED